MKQAIDFELQRDIKLIGGPCDGEVIRPPRQTKDGYTVNVWKPAALTVTPAKFAFEHIGCGSMIPHTYKVMSDGTGRYHG